MVCQPENDPALGKGGYIHATSASLFFLVMKVTMGNRFEAATLRYLQS